MERETLRVEFVTPCFLGGASQTAEWRSASIRGELRWWFRAVAGAKHSLEEVRKAEEVIFGSTERQARLRIRALGGPEPQRRESDFDRRLLAKDIGERWQDTSLSTLQRLQIVRNGHEVRSNPLHYLGFGPIEAGHVERWYLPAGSEAQIQLEWRSGIQGDRKLFEDALWGWLNLGGLGAKGRKGYGSLRLIECSPGSSCGPKDREEFKKRASELLARYRTDVDPGWTHFSSRSRIFLATGAFLSWQDAMEYLGSWLIAFRRRYGSPNDSRIVDGLPLKDRDYEWAAPGGGHLTDEIPDRAGFGLPLPFKRRIGGNFFGENVNWSRGGGKDESEPRRASPLLLHVAHLGAWFVPVLTHLPAALTPADGRLKFQDHPQLFSPTQRQLGIIDEFLGDLASKELIEEVKP